MKLTLFLSLIFACCFVSCNKEIETIERPPFTLYPSPFVNVLNISFAGVFIEDGTSNFTLRDGSNTVIFSSADVESESNYTLQTSVLDKGIYYADFENNGTIYSETIVKAK